MRSLFAALAALTLLTTAAYADAVPQLVNYQGKVYQPSGAAVPDGAYKIAFSIYDVPTGGTAIWTETYGALQVKGSAFHVLLGSINPIGASIFGTADRYLGVKLGTDPELSPRQKIASVPYAMVAETVADGSVTTAKVAAGAITAEKLAPGVGVPAGTVVMWSGAADAIPYGWALCDGTNGTPDLRDRFIVGAGAEYAVGATGGSADVALTAAQLPQHQHLVNPPVCDTTDNGDHGGHITCGGTNPYGHQLGGAHIFENVSGSGNHRHSIDIPPFWSAYSGGDQPHENRPPYYALCFIMKVAG